MPNPSTTSSLPFPAPLGRATVRNFPVSLFAAVMGFAGLALAWRVAHVVLGAPAWIGEAAGALALAVFGLVSAAYLGKLARHPQAVRAEFGHPVAGNFFGTIGISILLLSAVVAPYGVVASQVLWTAGLLMAFALGGVVVSRLLRGEVDASHAVPAWLVPGVATLDIAVTGGAMPMAWAAQANLCAGAVGAVLALVLFSLILGRLVHREPLAPAMTPSLMILVAPFAVGFLAYVNIAGRVDRFAGLLFYFGLFMFAVVAGKVFRPSVRFTPSWWAIGFPMAALANAALRYADAMSSGPLLMLATALLGALSLAIAVLAVRTLRLALGGELFA